MAQSVHDLYYNPGRPLESAETHRDFRTSKEEWIQGRDAVRPSKVTECRNPPSLKLLLCAGSHCGIGVLQEL